MSPVTHTMSHSHSYSINRACKQLSLYQQLKYLHDNWLCPSHRQKHIHRHQSLSASASASTRSTAVRCCRLFSTDTHSTAPLVNKDSNNNNVNDNINTSTSTQTTIKSSSTITSSNQTKIPSHQRHTSNSVFHKNEPQHLFQQIIKEIDIASTLRDDVKKE